MYMGYLFVFMGGVLVIFCAEFYLTLTFQQLLWCDYGCVYGCL